MKCNNPRAPLKYPTTDSDKIVEFGVGGGTVVDLVMIKHATINATTIYLGCCTEGGGYIGMIWASIYVGMKDLFETLSGAEFLLGIYMKVALPFTPVTVFFVVTVVVEIVMLTFAFVGNAEVEGSSSKYTLLCFPKKYMCVYG